MTELTLNIDAVKVFGLFFGLYLFFSFMHLCNCSLSPFKLLSLSFLFFSRLCSWTSLCPSIDHFNFLKLTHFHSSIGILWVRSKNKREYCVTATYGRRNDYLQDSFHRRSSWSLCKSLSNFLCSRRRLFFIPFHWYGRFNCRGFHWFLLFYNWFGFGRNNLGHFSFL